ncbi:hypothetical protein ADUPG1_010793 [Aduncisulcus paluster]|uniref:D-glutamate cyclase-like C-terminal domain-containing protein n=1 Tax=Aduncisulcus paluster TaxID=2918883 RepID=A0ABQ5JWW7_9EUKA|nr:hypothetical protein ADUPG1_010793 [Aduncisulcus paluster]
MVDISPVIEKIHHIIQEDIGFRGIRRLFPFSDLKGAVSTLSKCSNVLIGTGFYIPLCKESFSKDDIYYGRAETDGPLGTIQLAYILTKLNINVKIVCEHSTCHPLHDIKLFCKGNPGKIEVHSFPIAQSSDILPSSPADVIETIGTTPLKAEDESMSDISSSYSDYLDKGTHKHFLISFSEYLLKYPFEYDSVISIERVGPSFDGLLYNMRGISISSMSMPFHEAFELAKRLHIPTIAIGDGGNEIGMGNEGICEIVSSDIKYGSQIHCKTLCESLIVCGVSNWGAFSLGMGVYLHKLINAPICGGIDILEEGKFIDSSSKSVGKGTAIRMTNFDNIMEQFRMIPSLSCVLRNIVSHGAIDGVTHRLGALSVDGIEEGKHVKIEELVRKEVENFFFNFYH